MYIQQLKTFVATYETGSMNRASELLFITQPAVSQHIKKLETELGSTFFDRKNGTITPTEAGRCFYPYAKKVLNTLEEAQRALQQYSVQTPLELYLSSHNAHSAVLEMITNFCAKHPEVDVQVHSLSRPDYNNLPYQIKEHCLYLLSAPWVARAEVTFQELYRAKFHCILRKGHPLENKEILKLEDLRNEVLFLPPANSETMRTIVSDLRAVVPAGNLRQSSSFTGSQINILASDAICIAPDYLPLMDGLTSVPYQTEHSLPIGVFYTGKATRQMQQFLKYAKKYFAED